MWKFTNLIFLNTYVFFAGFEVGFYMHKKYAIKHERYIIKAVSFQFRDSRFDDDGKSICQVREESSKIHLKFTPPNNQKVFRIPLYLTKRTLN